MKIVLTVACIHKLGGTEKATIDLANLLSKDMNNEIIILSLYKEISEREAKLSAKLNDNIKVVYLNKKEVYLSRDYRYFKLKEILGVSKISKKIASFEPDVVIHSQIEHVKRVKGILNFTIIHTSYYACQQSFYTMFLLKKRLKDVDKIVFLNEIDSLKFNKEFRSSKAITIPNSTSLSISKRTDLENKKMIFMGRLDNNVKQISHLIEVIYLLKHSYSLKEWKLDIYGEGKDKEFLKNLILEKGLAEDVRLKGQATDLENTLSKYDIMLLSSKYEGMPMVLLEAASSGLALFSYNCTPSISKIIREGKNGYIISQDDIEEYAEKLNEVLHNPSVLNKMGENSLNIMNEDFSANNILKIWERELKSSVRKL